MIIGSEFSDKSKLLLKQIGQIADGNSEKKMSVQTISKDLELDRTEIKNFLEYLQELGYIEIVTIGGPLLYGHIKITDEGLEKYASIGDLNAPVTSTSIRFFLAGQGLLFCEKLHTLGTKLNRKKVSYENRSTQRDKNA